MTEKPTPPRVHPLPPRKGPEARLKIRGAFRLEVIGPDGKTKDVREKRNLIVNAGLDYLKELILDSVSPTTKVYFDRIGIGTDATPETPADVALGAETARQVPSAYTSGGTGIASIETTFAAGVGTGAIAEAAIMKGAGPGGSHLNRVTFAAVNKAAGDALKVTFTLTIANA